MQPTSAYGVAPAHWDGHGGHEDMPSAVRRSPRADRVLTPPLDRLTNQFDRRIFDANRRVGMPLRRSSPRFSRPLATAFVGVRTAHLATARLPRDMSERRPQASFGGGPGQGGLQVQRAAVHTAWAVTVQHTARPDSLLEFLPNCSHSHYTRSWMPHRAASQ